MARGSVARRMASLERALGRGDAHCSVHVGKPECKLGRTLKQGTLGLSTLWQERAEVCESRQEHRSMKSVFSSVVAFA